MPTSREFTITMLDQPGTLGRTCRSLADRGVNILGFQSFSAGAGESQVRLPRR
jgi:acetolactate synthase small subunit